MSERVSPMEELDHLPRERVQQQQFLVRFQRDFEQYQKPTHPKERCRNCKSNRSLFKRDRFNRRRMGEE